MTSGSNSPQTSVESPLPETTTSKARRVFVQNPKYPNNPPLLKHFESRANYYKKKYPTAFYIVTGTFSAASIAVPISGLKRTGKLVWWNALIFGAFWSWVCFSRDLFQESKGIRKWYLPDDFYVLVPKDEVDKWKEMALKEWVEKESQEESFRYLLERVAPEKIQTKTEDEETSTPDEGVREKSDKI